MRPARSHPPWAASLAAGTLIAGTLAAGTLVFVTPAAAQAPPESSEPFGEVIDVRVVNVEAVVTDRAGNRVTGLGPEDFRLVVDGEETPIDYFTEVRGGVAAEPDPESGPGAAGDRPPAVEAGEPVGRSFLLYIDEITARPHDRDRVIDGLRDQVAHLRPEDRMAVVAFDGRQLEMLQNWTSSQQELDRALRDARGRPAHGMLWDAERRVVNRRLAGNIDAPPADEFNPFRLGFDDLDLAERTVARLERAVSGSTAALRVFGGPPGRKVMLLLAGEWPFAIDRWIAGGRNRVVNDPSIESGADIYGPLVDTANLLGYTLYPVDLRGLDSQRLSDRRGGLPDPTSGGILQESLVHDTFEYLAQATGGRALLNALSTDALAEAAVDTRSFYWLGFTAERAGDEDRHRIKLKVLRPGLSVRTRDSFRDLSRQHEITLAVESGVRFGGVPGAMPLPGELGEPEKSGRRRMEVPLKVAIPLDLVTFVPTRKGVEGRVELRIAALDELGETNEVPVVEVGVRLDEPPEPGKYSLYEAQVELRKLEHRLLISVHDAVSGRAAALEASVRPPS